MYHGLAILLVAVLQTSQMAECAFAHFPALTSTGKKHERVLKCSFDSGYDGNPEVAVDSIWTRLTRPKPVVLSRRNLSQEFAVLLMRSAYDTVDELDICPMDGFQRRFFELRQREWSYYIQENRNIVQGLLTDVRCGSIVTTGG